MGVVEFLWGMPKERDYWEDLDWRLILK